MPEALPDTLPMWRAGVVVLALTVSSVVAAPAAFAQTITAPGADRPQRELVIGTKETPPFVIKSGNGDWSGISVELWRQLADDLHLRYRFSEVPDVPALIDGVADGRFDVGVGALTVTAERERRVDFTAPFFATGLGIAVPAGGEASWRPILRAITSFGFAQATAALIGLALIVGLLVWLFERRHNEDFSGGVAKGISSGVWWSATTMTQRSVGGFGPRTLPGRIIAIVWMIGSVVTIAVFTAGLTSALTIKHLQGAVHSISDLSAVRVGAVAGTSTEDTLSRLRIRYRKFSSPAEGLAALRARAIDAFVYDRPLLAWLVHQKFASSLELVDATFEPQDYAFALPNESVLRKAINVAMLGALHTEWWDQTTFRYLGTR